MSEFTKAQGSKIVIQFTYPITTDPSTCPPEAFTVTGSERWMPGGELTEREYAVESVDYRTPPIAEATLDSDEDFNEGSSDGLMVVDAGLRLDVSAYV